VSPVFTTTIKTLLAAKRRLFTTASAVLLGVAFMAGTLVLTDTIGKTVTDFFASLNAGTDAYVRGKAAPGLGGERPLVDAAVVRAVAAVPGVKAAEGSVTGYAQLVDRRGKAIGNGELGAAPVGAAWSQVDTLNPFDLVTGRPPRADDEVVVDKASADKARLAVGDTATVLVQTGPQRVRVVGTARFGAADGPAGGSVVLFTRAAAERLVGQPGKVDGIGVTAAEGVAQQELRDRIAKVTPPSVEVVTGKVIEQENRRAVKDLMSVAHRFLLTFALIALLVGAFIIYNTFSILVAQRTRDLALLRAVGASRRQVLGSVLLEAVVVGLVAAVLGLVAGIGVAAGLEALLTGFGLDIPAAGIVLTGRTVLASVLTGLLVSVGSAVLPARRASKVPPIAALRDLAHDRSGRSRRRMVAGSAVVATGAASLSLGLLSQSERALPAVGLGAAAIFLGVAVLGPVIARPVSRLIAAPLPALVGMPGRLARENAIRNPRRTAATAAALMVGVSLVCFVTIVAASSKASSAAQVDRAFAGDFVVDAGSLGAVGLSHDLAERLGRLPKVKAASGVRQTVAQVGGTTADLFAVDPATYGKVVDLQLTRGRLEDLDADGIAVREGLAAARGWSVGDAVTVRFAQTGEQRLTVAAVYRARSVVGDYLVGLAAYEANAGGRLDTQVLVAKADGVPAADARAAIEKVTADYPTARLHDQTQYKQAQAAQIDRFVNLVYLLLALAVLIALLGIANTLALSILERTRELGLLRAVGMTRRQLRSMVRWESVIIALFGAFLGLAVGVLAGWSMVTAAADKGARLQLPAGQLATVTAVAALAGMLAAVLPARRASRLNVLAAVAAD
jgi:putative ABC transport system permease protein